VRTADAKLREIWIQERQPTIPDILAERLEKNILLVGSIDDLERNLRQLDGGTTIEVDLKARVELQQRAAMDAEILDRIRTRTFAYLCRVETDLSIAVDTAHIFDAHRSRVDQFLRDVASDVLEKFSSAYRRVAEGEKESGSQALTSCPGWSPARGSHRALRQLSRRLGTRCGRVPGGSAPGGLRGRRG